MVSATPRKRLTLLFLVAIALIVSPVLFTGAMKTGGPGFAAFGVGPEIGAEGGAPPKAPAERSEGGAPPPEPGAAGAKPWLRDHEEGAEETSSTQAQIQRLCVGLVVFSLVLIGAVLGVRRYARGRGLHGAGRRMRMVETLPLGGRRFICLMSLDRRDIVLGVSQEGIRLLTEVVRSADADAEPESDDPLARHADFPSVLREASR